MTGLFLDHPLFFSGALFVLLVIAVESGFQIAVLSAANLDEDREQIAASRDSLGILLSLLLGFTLAMALPRFDLRKQLVLDEANAIATTGLRAGFLPQAQRIQTRELLIQYVAARQAYSQASLGPGINDSDRPHQINPNISLANRSGIRPAESNRNRRSFCFLVKRND